MKVAGIKSARLFAILVATGAIAAFAWAGPAVASARAAEISGTVTGPGGTPPLAGVTVCLARSGEGALCEVSGADGGYVFSGLAAGSYGISYEPGEGQNYLPASFTGISLGASSAIVVEESLRRGAEFEGHLTDAATGLPIEPTGDPATTTKACALRSEDEEVVKCVLVGAGGAYALAGLPTGSYVIVFGADAKEAGFVVAEDGYTRQYYAGKPKFEEGRVELIEAGAVATGVDAALVRGAEIWPGEEPTSPTGPGGPGDDGDGSGGGSSTPITPPAGVPATPIPPTLLPTSVPPHRPPAKVACKKGFRERVKDGRKRCVRVKATKPKPHAHRCKPR
jgi:hypothetical protein